MSSARSVLFSFFCLSSLLAGPVGAAPVPPLHYAGATTLQQFFMPEAARAFETATGIGCAIAGGNTDAGLKALRDGQIELAGAGRFLTAAEKSAGLREHLLGWDTLAVLVHPSNPVENVTSEQLRAIFSGQIRDWKELGGRDLPIMVVAAPKESGMHNALQQLILGKEPLANGAVTALIVSDLDLQVAQWPGAICLLSLSMIEGEQTKSLQINGITPSAEQVKSGRYPLKKPLLLVTRHGGSPAAEQFVAFSLDPDGQRLLSKHFIPIRPQ